MIEAKLKQPTIKQKHKTNKETTMLTKTKHSR